MNTEFRTQQKSRTMFEEIYVSECLKHGAPATSLFVHQILDIVWEWLQNQTEKNYLGALTAKKTNGVPAGDIKDLPVGYFDVKNGKKELLFYDFPHRKDIVVQLDKKLTPAKKIIDGDKYIFHLRWMMRILEKRASCNSWEDYASSYSP